MNSLRDEFENKILTLNQTSWENLINRDKIDKWLQNFENEKEQLNALYLLSNFMYFGSRQIRELLRTLYRDIYKYPIVSAIRKDNNDTKDLTLINKLFDDSLVKTRFLGIGNPSESGPHLLYYFRQENRLPKGLFINAHEIFKRFGSTDLQINNSQISRYVCIDDFCGSGSQGLDFAEQIVRPLKDKDKNARVDYFVLFGTKVGKEKLRAIGLFDSVKSVFTITESFKCFSATSRYFQNVPTEIEKTFAEAMCKKHGYPLIKSICMRLGHPDSDAHSLANNHSLGFEDGQLLIGFHHNTPDNTLPIIWYNEEVIKWTPIFKRYNKIYE